MVKNIMRDPLFLSQKSEAEQRKIFRLEET